MARPRKYDVKAEASKLLAMTLKGTQAKYKECEELGIPVDAATISASVALLKLTEAWANETKDSNANELAKLQQEFLTKTNTRSPATTTGASASRDELLAEYGLSASQ